MARDSAGDAFTERDLPLLIDVLHAHQPLESTAYAVRRVELATSYPIENRLPLEVLLEGADHIQVGSCTVTLNQLREQLPDSLFPIADRTELITKFVMALMRGQLKQFEELPLDGEPGEVDE
jgi:hypothetical protein